jgi:SAM-dependent methyltransferase
MAAPPRSPPTAAAALPVGLATMAPAMAEAHNYYAWIAERLAPHVGRRVLDVGGGRGSLLARFLDRERLYALDIGEDAVAFLRAAFAHAPHVEARVGDVTDPAVQAAYVAEGVDTVLCTNVLEHIEDDGAMLRAFAAILAPCRGRLALLVPAHAWLYGSLDAAAGHFRRYTRRQVVDRLAAAGFEVEEARYFNALAVPGWWLAGRVRRQGLEDASSNAQVLFYDRWLLPLSRGLERLVRLPFGLSVVAFARARDR